MKLSFLFKMSESYRTLKAFIPSNTAQWVKAGGQTDLVWISIWKKRHFENYWLQLRLQQFLGRLKKFHLSFFTIWRKDPPFPHCAWLILRWDWPDCGRPLLLTVLLLALELARVLAVDSHQCNACLSITVLQCQHHVNKWKARILKNY